jgi:YcxB-like protein
MIQLTFTLSTPEIIRLTRSQQLNWTKRWYWIAGIVFVLSAVFAQYTDRWSSLLTIGLPLLLFVVVFEWQLPRQMERQLNKMPNWGKPVTMEFSELQILQKTANSEATVQWQSFTKATELPDWFLLHLGPKTLYWSIPKRAFDSPEQMEAFRMLLKTKQLMS